MPFNKWMLEQIIVQTAHGILLSNKKEWTSTKLCWIKKVCHINTIYIEREITNRNLLYIPRNSTQYSVMPYMGKSLEKSGYKYLYNWSTLLYSGTHGLPMWHSGKESACQCRRHRRCEFNSWIGKIPWKRKWQPTPVFLPGESHR